MNKSRLMDLCKHKAQSQLDDLTAAFVKVKESIEGEDKSSAGDKYETARAMAQTEMERLGFQLQKARTEFNVLSMIDPGATTEHVQIGSIVETKSKTMFVAIALGKVNLDGKDVFVISPSSPIGQLILGKSAGFTYSLGSNTDSIVRVS